MIPHSQWAKALHQSARTQKPRDQFSTQHTYTLDDAYTVQHALIQERVQEGHTIIGLHARRRLYGSARPYSGAGPGGPYDHRRKNGVHFRR